MFDPNNIGQCYCLDSDLNQGDINAKVEEYNRTIKQMLTPKPPEEKRKAITAVLKQDPRPAYDTDETRVYGVEFAGFDVRFTVEGECLKVKELVKLNRN